MGKLASFIAIAFIFFMMLKACDSCSGDDYTQVKDQDYFKDSLLNAMNKEADSLSKLPLAELVKLRYEEVKTKPPTSLEGDFKDLLNKSKNTVYEKKVKKTADSLNVVIKQDVSERISNEHLSDKEKFRNAFLDNGLDIEVEVTGKDLSILTLKYVLFNDVWFRKFETEGTFDVFANKGFKKIILTDGYGYRKWMSY